MHLLIPHDELFCWRYFQTAHMHRAGPRHVAPVLRAGGLGGRRKCIQLIQYLQYHNRRVDCQLNQLTWKTGTFISWPPCDLHLHLSAEKMLHMSTSKTEALLELICASSTNEEVLTLGGKKLVSHLHEGEVEGEKEAELRAPVTVRKTSPETTEGEKIDNQAVLMQELC